MYVVDANSVEFSAASFLRKLGDSNSWYDNSHGSLANCWFQPLTQTSNFVSAKTLFVKSSAKVGFLFQLAKRGVAFFELGGKKTSPKWGGEAWERLE